MIGRVLIVDDEVDMLKLLRLILEHAGLEVLATCDGDQALRQAADHQPDLVICDLVMPRPNGYEMLKALRGNVKTRHVPVLVLSARVHPKDTEHAFQLGADSFVPKPFLRRHLLDEIQRCLAKRQRPAMIHQGAALPA